MAKPNEPTVKMRYIELLHGGRPIREIVVDAYNRTGGIRGAARELGVTPSTLHSWLKKLDIRTRRIAE